MAGIDILLVGRDPASLEIIRKMLKFHNQQYEVDFATDAFSCLEKAKSKRYDLILLDNDLPDRSGIDILPELRGSCPDVPVIVMVEDGQDDLAIAATERGADDYVMKVRGYLTALPFTVLKAVESRKSLRRSAPDRKGVSEASVKETGGDAEGNFVLDRRGRFLSADRTVESIVGYAQNELLELSITDLLGRGSEPEFARFLLRVGEGTASARVPVVRKSGDTRVVEVKLSPIKDDAGAVAGYRGRLRDVSTEAAVEMMERRVDQHQLARELARAAEDAAEQPVQVLLQRLAEIAAQQFRFLRATVALLDQRRHVFVKQALVGFEPEELASKAMEVPKQLVDRIFQERFRIKVIYSDQEFLDHPRLLPGGLPERRTQVRRPAGQWDPRDLVLVALNDLEGKTFGFITLEQPVDNIPPNRDTFYNLELFGILASSVVESALRNEAKERRYRRLKQFVAAGRLHRLDQPFPAALKDTAWLVRFLSDFDLVLIGIISRESERLEFRAAACEDRLRATHLSRTYWTLSELRGVLKAQYRLGNSYLITKEEKPLASIKSLYYGADWRQRSRGDWGPWHALVVPIRTRQGKIVGVLLVDDPPSGRIPSREAVHLLELMAGQVGLAIENRVYLLRTGEPKRVRPRVPPVRRVEEEPAGLRKLIDRFLH